MNFNKLEYEKKQQERKLKIHHVWKLPIAFFRRWQQYSTEKYVKENCKGKILEIGANNRTYFKDSEIIDIATNGKDIENGIEQKDKTYDYIIMEEVIEHLHPEKQEFVLKEISRTLKDNGTFIWSTPNKKLYHYFTFFDKEKIRLVHLSERTFVELIEMFSKNFKLIIIKPFADSPCYWGICKKQKEEIKIENKNLYITIIMIILFLLVTTYQYFLALK